ncbi:MAG: hypothetical protein HN580_24200 [Deltaproteobacteria bacterium]|nr:hypothetical protein [Deltaproteobacteria bacterium]MBT4642017.1 hypothetical protein [Deltaproteobacteria bacterium]MBT6499760.1 hypothetical protein [Deltaproteobacteria bacterium]MBT6611857.1 hypothetical protein [Deltaproteobacteria bacterium]MBT7151460.1 hypothetical protein [Deltaproteobacteria bacterium]
MFFDLLDKKQNRNRSQDTQDQWSCRVRGGEAVSIGGLSGGVAESCFLFLSDLRSSLAHTSGPGLYWHEIGVDPDESKEGLIEQQQ